MKKFALILAVIAFIPIAVMAESLQKVITDELGNVFYYDQDSIQKDGDKINFWGIVEVNDQMASQYKEMTGLNVRTNKMHMIVDCSNKKVAHLEYVNFDETGKEVEKASAETEEWADINFEKPLGKMFEIICGQ